MELLFLSEPHIPDLYNIDLIRVSDVYLIQYFTHNRHSGNTYSHGTHNLCSTQKNCMRLLEYGKVKGQYNVLKLERTAI